MVSTDQILAGVRPWTRTARPVAVRWEQVEHIKRVHQACYKLRGSPSCPDHGSWAAPFIVTTCPDDAPGTLVRLMERVVAFLVFHMR